MATLREYFETDFPNRAMSQHTTLNLTMADGASYSVHARVHSDFNSGTKYVAFLVPRGRDAYGICDHLVSNPQLALDAVARATEVKAHYPGQRWMSTAELRFSGRIFLYTDDVFSAEEMARLEGTAKTTNGDLIVFSSASAQERSRVEKPLAFISHDSRDKAEFARPIAEELSKLRCPVWYDEYSLHVGANLRASIEKGLKECKKCVLVLSPNFLSNTGWTKTEFDSVFTRQILDGSDVMLPVWCGVTKQQIYEYSPTLLDRVAVSWDSGLEEVVRKLYRAIESPLSNYSRA